MKILAIKKSVELSKGGKPYARVLIQTDEHTDGKGNPAWISGFGNKITWAWKVGDVVDANVTQEGKYFNFNVDESEEDRLDVYRLPATIGFVMELIKGKQPHQAKPSTPARETPPVEVDEEEDIRPEDIPF